jgi:hypothetical protein
MDRWVKGRTPAYAKSGEMVLNYLKSQFSGHPDDDFCVQVGSAGQSYRVAAEYVEVFERLLYS